MFNRDRMPGLPGSSPRPPNRGPPPQQQPPPQRSPGYDTRMGGYEDQGPPGYGQRMPVRGPPPGRGGGGGGPSMQLRPVKSPGGNAYALANLYVPSSVFIQALSLTLLLG